LSASRKHGGKRKGAGRKPAPEKSFLKKFRASEAERIEFMSLLTNDAREDFLIVLAALRVARLPTLRAVDGATRAEK